MAKQVDNARAAALLDGYSNALYEVDLPDTRVVIQIGRPPPVSLARLLAARGDDEAALLSAANPRSVALSEAENAARHTAFVRDLGERGLAYLPATGRDAHGPWCETSALVMGIDGRVARALAEHYGQYAWVSIRAAQPARLLMSGAWPAHWPQPRRDR